MLTLYTTPVVYLSLDNLRLKWEGAEALGLPARSRGGLTREQLIRAISDFVGRPILAAACFQQARPVSQEPPRKAAAANIGRPTIKVLLRNPDSFGGDTVTTWLLRREGFQGKCRVQQVMADVVYAGRG